MILFRFFAILVYFLFVYFPINSSQSSVKVKSAFKDDTVYRINFSSSPGVPGYYCSPKVVTLGNLSFLSVNSLGSASKSLLINLSTVSSIIEDRTGCQYD